MRSVSRLRSFGSFFPPEPHGWTHLTDRIISGLGHLKNTLRYSYKGVGNHRRKFRSQTSDNMDRWKAEQGRGREKRKIRRKKSRRERVRTKKMQMREKVGKSRNTVFFQWFGAPEGRKVGSLKRRVRSQLAKWEMKNCTPLWREAHFQVKMYKTHQVRTTFGSWDVEKVHAVVARSTFPSENVQNTPGADHFWQLRCRKSARRCGAKHISKWKCTKHTRCGPLLAVEMSKKCTPLWREAHLEVKMYKAPHVCATFGGSDVVSRGRRKGLCTLSKVTKTWGFCSISKNGYDGRHGTFEEDLQRCIFVAGTIQKTCSWEMLGSQGADFLRGVAFWSIRCAGLLRWFCMTGAAVRMTWHQFSVAGAIL